MGIITLKDCPVAKRPGFTKNKWEDAVLRIFARVVFPAFVLLSVLDAARAEAIAIGNYGASANGMISSGTTLRAEAAPGCFTSLD